jgi:hypothetical protein
MIKRIDHVGILANNLADVIDSEMEWMKSPLNIHVGYTTGIFSCRAVTG